MDDEGQRLTAGALGVDMTTGYTHTFTPEVRRDALQRAFRDLGKLATAIADAERAAFLRVARAVKQVTDGPS